MNQEYPEGGQPHFTPNPDPGPVPGPLPEPFPGPFPGPLPGPGPLPDRPLPIPWPPDWFRCLRLGPVSGRYEGDMTSPTAGRYRLDLRVDIDVRYANSPVMNRVSGDIYQVYTFRLLGRPAFTWTVYRESWIVDNPVVTWSRCNVVVTGTVRYWKGIHPFTTVRIVIPWTTFSPAGPAEVTFSAGGGITTQNYSCARKSDCFRSMGMEIDVAASVNTPPLLPSYSSHWHNNRPPDTPQRTLTIEESYREAGVCVEIDPAHTVIDDSAAQFNSWSPAELHDAMEVHYSKYAAGWPKWHMWGLLAGTFDSPSVGGIMFDAAAMYGGAGRPPERQGFAVFRNHSWFNNLVAGTPANQDQAWAMRHFLYTWVHEAGHAFNLLHSWNKSRPDSLSWMNYDWRYDQRNGSNTFWGNFRFRFDDEELIHIRHGDRAAVIMGGDPWASGGHLETPEGAMAQTMENAPIELLVRSKPYFDFMEPVAVEVRLRNELEDVPLDVDVRLNPEFGGIIFYIQRPDGRILEYAPIMCKVGEAEMRTLKPRTPDLVEGEDRYSENVFLSYGAYGFYFDTPGEYLVRAAYQGAGDMVLLSNIHRIRVAAPVTREEDREAQDFFTNEVGLSLYLNGSQSPFLKKGMEVLESIARSKANTLAGAKIASIVAQSVADDFFRIQKPDKPKLVRTHTADPKLALELTDAALKLARREKIRELNLFYHSLVRERAGFLAAAGQKEEAKKELQTLRRDLAARDVNQPVLEEIKAFEQSL